MGRITPGVSGREAILQVVLRRSRIPHRPTLLVSALVVLIMFVPTSWARASSSSSVSVALIRTPASITSAAIASDGAHLWIANTSATASAGLFEVVADKLQPVLSSLITAPRLLAATSDGIYMVNSNDVVTVTNPVSEVTTALSDSSINNPVALVAQGGYLWVLNAPRSTNTHGSITGFDLATGQVTRVTNQAFSAPVQMVATTSALWVLNKDGSLDRVSLDTKQVTTLQPAGETITNMASDATGLYLMVTSGITSSLLSVNPVSEDVTTFTNTRLANVTSMSVSPTTVWLTSSTGGLFNDGSLVSFDRVASDFGVVSDASIFNPVAVAVVGTVPWFMGNDAVDDVVIGAVTAAPASAFTQGVLPPRSPSTSLAPWPNPMNGACQLDPFRDSFVVSAACTSEQLQSIDVAHELEHIRPMTLPTNWATLNPPEQLFVLADLERVERKLPPFLGLNRALSSEASRAVRRNEDPSPAPGFVMSATTTNGLAALAGTWSQNFSPLSADYFWMYNDGWAGALTGNLACTSAKSSGCWAHRDELLGLAAKMRLAVGLQCRTCEMGAATYLNQVSAHPYTSYADLVERPAGAPPPMYFTWAKNVVPHLP